MRENGNCGRKLFYEIKTISIYIENTKTKQDAKLTINLKNGMTLYKTEDGSEIIFDNLGEAVEMAACNGYTKVIRNEGA